MIVTVFQRDPPRDRHINNLPAVKKGVDITARGKSEEYRTAAGTVLKLTEWNAIYAQILLSSSRMRAFKLIMLS